MILTLDPSSTRTGYAAMKDAATIQDAGYLRPARTKDDSEARIDAMVTDLKALLLELKPERVVIEVPSGLPGAGIKAGAKAQLCIYGVAVGEIRRAAKEVMEDVALDVLGATVVSVTEREWTRGRTKQRRRDEMGLRFPSHAAAFARDSGGDVVDAIGIGVWWFERGQTQRW